MLRPAHYFAAGTVARWIACRREVEIDSRCRLGEVAGRKGKYKREISRCSERRTGNGSDVHISSRHSTCGGHVDGGNPTHLGRHEGRADSSAPPPTVPFTYIELYRPLR